jgi:hypothetical protein
VVVVVGEATGFAIVELLKDAAGDQIYELAPEADKVVFEPMQIAALELLAVTIIPVTLIATASVEEHPFTSVPVSVYVVADEGEATGFEIVELLNDPDGVQTYVNAPEPFKVVLPPGQILASIPALTIGNGLTVMVTLSEEEQPFPSVPVTVYVVVVVAVDIGFGAVELLSDAEGVQT